MPCLTRSVGRTLASKCNVVTQLNTLLLSDASNLIISLTKPSAICWQALTTSFGGSFFGAFADRSKSFSSFGVNIWIKRKINHMKVLNETTDTKPSDTYTCQQAVQPLQTRIVSHANYIQHLIYFSFNGCLQRIWFEEFINRIHKKYEEIKPRMKIARAQRTWSLSAQGVNHIRMKTSVTSFWMPSSSFTRLIIFTQISGILSKFGYSMQMSRKILITRFRTDTPVSSIRFDSMS